jgi:hypothetical protein
MNTVLSEMLRTGVTANASGKQIRLHSAVSEGEGLFLEQLVSTLSPRLTLEIGLAGGVSALFICQALPPGARHMVIDPYQFADPYGDGWEGAGLAAIQRAGYKHCIEFYPFPSYVVLPQLQAKGTKIGFAFIDGWHTFDFTLVDFFFIDRMLEVGGVVAIDDVGLPAVKKVCQYVLSNLSYAVCGGYPAEQSRPSLKRRAVSALAKRSGWVARVARPEFSTDFGLYSDCRCLALRKLSDDVRPWDYHTEF